MRITWDEFYDGENGTRPLHLEVDEPYRSYDIYVYMTPVVGENTYMSAQPITLDEDGKADYLVPGDVLDGVGYFQAQIVAIGPNEKIVKSDTETIPTGESVPDKSAVLPTGEVITLADVKAELDSLTASSIPYTDTEEIGVDNVQDAIDYAINHGGGGGLYTAGTGIDIEDDVISIDTDYLGDNYQGVLTAGDGISIVNDVISVSYTNGDEVYYG